MLIVKGILLGVAMFAVFNVVYFWACGFISSTGAVAVGVLRSVTIGNTFYWISAALMLALGCVIMQMWPVKVMP